MREPYDLELVAGQLGTELQTQLSRSSAPSAVAALRTAISDLQGSISRDALPEMALRLAYFRLSGSSLDAFPAARGSEKKVAGAA